MEALSRPTNLGRPSRRGFTLVELLVVIAIIGVLVSLLLPAVQAAREAARRSQCTNNLKQMGLGVQNYMSANDDMLPVGYAGQPSWVAGANFNKRHIFTSILPYMEQQQIYDQIIFEYTIAQTPFNDPAKNQVINTYICPSWTDPVIAQGVNGYDEGALITYSGISGATKPGLIVNTLDLDASDYINSAFGQIPKNGVFAFERVPAKPNGKFLGRERKGSEITDGQSNTLMIGEFVHRNLFPPAGPQEPPGQVRPWYLGGFQDGTYSCKTVEFTPNSQLSSATVSFNHLPMGSFHPSTTLFTHVDGSVHAISDDIDLTAYYHMATADGEDIVNASN